MMSQAAKNGNLIESTLPTKTGMFFDQGKNQVRILKATNPKKSLENYKGKVLFINGQLDHRDSEKIWAESCDGKLIVYEGADHFFSHDKRFLDKFMADVTEFISKN